MSQNHKTDKDNENDLQKAIDDITNRTNSDPAFADPVAAPSSIPEDDNGELAEPVGPFPVPQVAVVQPVEQMAPIDPINIPDLPLPTSSDSSTDSTMPPVDTDDSTDQVATDADENSTTTHQDIPLNVKEIKQAALRDLVPLLDHLDMSPSQKFNTCRDVLEELQDYTVLEPAYHAASEITDDHERAEALFYLVESIDKM